MAGRILGELKLDQVAPQEEQTIAHEASPPLDVSEMAEVPQCNQPKPKSTFVWLGILIGILTVMICWSFCNLLLPTGKQAFSPSVPIAIPGRFRAVAHLRSIYNSRLEPEPEAFIEYEFPPTLDIGSVSNPVPEYV